jgi:6-phosphogluconolactonase
MVDLHRFASADELDRFAANRVGGLLVDALAARPSASLVVPGGKTPARFLTLLGEADLDWSRVQVTLSDERWVPASAPESNEGMLRRTLLAGRAKVASFVSLYADAPSPEQGIGTVKARLAVITQPLDVVVLGMGTDGHFASLFPGDASLADGLDMLGKELCLAARGLADGPYRLSLTLPFLASARQVFVFASGEVKKAVWEEALAGVDFPIAALQRQDRAPVDFLWCP